MAMINRIRLYMGTGLVRGLYNNLETENNINYSYQMIFCESVDRKQLVNLLTGMLGIYTLYFIAGILHESLTKRPHYNRITRDYEICHNTVAILVIPFLFSWILGLIYNLLFLRQRVNIPLKNSAITASAVVIASLFSLLAIQKTSFPVVIMFQSCSILPVVFIGVFCSRVHDPNLQLGPQKIIVALIITAGILTFEFADPQTRQRQLKQQFIGILFLVFHFIAEGFLPDLQAEIKVNFKPQPTEMMADINKWCTILTLIVSIVVLDAWPFIVFMWQHPQFTIDLILMSFVSGLGQFFVYRMIKQFKQHFVPFTISSRKILTASISIAFYGHQTNWIQIMGISVVLFTVFVEFMIEITKRVEPQRQRNGIDMQLNEQNFGDEPQRQRNAVDMQLNEPQRQRNAVDVQLNEPQRQNNGVDMQLNEQNFGDELRPSTGSNQKLSQKQKDELEQKTDQKQKSLLTSKIQSQMLDKQSSEQIEQSKQKQKDRQRNVPEQQIKKEIQQVKTVGSKGDQQIKIDQRIQLNQ